MENDIKNIVRKNLTMLLQNYGRLNNHSLISFLKRFTKIEKTAIKIVASSIMDSLVKIPLATLSNKKAPVIKPRLIFRPRNSALLNNDGLVENIIAIQILNSALKEKICKYQIKD